MYHMEDKYNPIYHMEDKYNPMYHDMEDNTYPENNYYDLMYHMEDKYNPTYHMEDKYNPMYHIEDNTYPENDHYDMYHMEDKYNPIYHMEDKYNPMYHDMEDNTYPENNYYYNYHPGQASYEHLYLSEELKDAGYEHADHDTYYPEETGYDGSYNDHNDYYGSADEHTSYPEETYHEHHHGPGEDYPREAEHEHMPPCLEDCALTNVDFEDVSSKCEWYFVEGPVHNNQSCFNDCSPGINTLSRKKWNKCAAKLKRNMLIPWNVSWIARLKTLTHTLRKASAHGSKKNKGTRASLTVPMSS